MAVECKIEWEDLNRKMEKMFPMPQIMAKILQEVNNPNASAASLEKILKNDPSFTLKILALANSSYYGVAAKVANIRAAITLLGLNMVKSIALHASVSDLFRVTANSFGFSGTELWKHSVGVGVCVKMVSRRLHLGNAEDYFTLGLLHDVGLLIEHQFFPEAADAVLKRLTLGPAKLTDVERELLGTDHEVLSALLCRKWSLPESVCTVVKFHHHPAEAPEALRRTTAAVYLANTIVQQAGYGFHYRSGENITGEVLKVLGIEDVDAQVMQEDFHREAAEISLQFA
ncbi:MAG: HDOD domain-containing protein [Candidatus Firestonebacteria bacterium]|nr:HDOD domain-containing protein [Candidatus Firestonebacteria bacterium]